MTRPQPSPHPCAAQAGLTLVELMVAMVLGLVVLGGVLGIVLGSSQNYRTSEALSEIQESTRTAFELMARDIRQAGDVGCGRASTRDMDIPGGNWWQTWRGLEGYAGGAGDPAISASTVAHAAGDTLHVQGPVGNGFAVTNHAPASDTITAPGANLAPGDILIACDFINSLLLQAAGGTNGNTIIYDSTGRSIRQLRQNAFVAPFTTTAWFVGNNGRPAEGGRSLYRKTNDATAEEIVAGISDMQLRYRQGNAPNFVSAGNVTDWLQVNAVEITLSSDSASQNVSSDNDRLSRTFISIVTLRNRTE